MNKEQLIQGLYNEYLGLRDQALAELSVYLENPVGVGEHGNIAEIVKEKLERVSCLNGTAQTMRELFMNGSEDDKVSEVNLDAVELPSEELDQS
jgi:hypothetical protein